MSFKYDERSDPQADSSSKSQNGSKTSIAVENDLMRIIECPVCQEIPFPPIFQCVTGHNICKSCRPKLKECPMCKEVFTDKRNYTVETLVQTSKHICLYNTAGCDLVMTGDLMEGHLDSCQYKPRPCPFLNCTQTPLEIRGYRDHFRSVHNVTMFTGETLIMNYKVETDALKNGLIKASCWCWRNLLSYDGNAFLIALILDFHAQLVYWSIVCLGVDKDAEKYEAEVILSSEKTRRGRLRQTWRFPVRSVLKGIKHADAEANDVYQPSCTFSAFLKLTRPSADDEKKCHITAKYHIHKSKPI